MGPGFNRALAAGLSRNWDRQDVMSDLAHETGGEAFFNMNDLSGIMARSIDAGGNYYTLAYVPRIATERQVSADQGASEPGRCEADYRRGYLAVPEQQVGGQDAQAMLSHAMQAGMPPSTMLMMRVQVLPRIVSMRRCGSITPWMRTTFGSKPRPIIAGARRRIHRRGLEQRQSWRWKRAGQRRGHVFAG